MLVQLMLSGGDSVARLELGQLEMLKLAVSSMGLVPGGPFGLAPLDVRAVCDLANAATVAAMRQGLAPPAIAALLTQADVSYLTSAVCWSWLQPHPHRAVATRALLALGVSATGVYLPLEDAHVASLQAALVVCAVDEFDPARVARHANVMVSAGAFGRPASAASSMRVLGPLDVMLLADPRTAAGLGARCSPVVALAASASGATGSLLGRLRLDSRLHNAQCGDPHRQALVLSCSCYSPLRELGYLDDFAACVEHGVADVLALLGARAGLEYTHIPPHNLSAFVRDILATGEVPPWAVSRPHARVLGVDGALPDEVFVPRLRADSACAACGAPSASVRLCTAIRRDTYDSTRAAGDASAGGRPARPKGRARGFVARVSLINLERGFRADAGMAFTSTCRVCAAHYTSSSIEVASDSPLLRSAPFVSDAALADEREACHAASEAASALLRAFPPFAEAVARGDQHAASLNKLNLIERAAAADGARVDAAGGAAGGAAAARGGGTIGGAVARDVARDPPAPVRARIRVYYEDAHQTPFLGVSDKLYACNATLEHFQLLEFKGKLSWEAAAYALCGDAGSPERLARGMLDAACNLRSMLGMRAAMGQQLVLQQQGKGAELFDGGMRQLWSDFETHGFISAMVDPKHAVDCRAHCFCLGIDGNEQTKFPCCAVVGCLGSPLAGMLVCGAHRARQPSAAQLYRTYGKTPPQGLPAVAELVEPPSDDDGDRGGRGGRSEVHPETMGASAGARARSERTRLRAEAFARSGIIDARAGDGDAAASVAGPPSASVKLVRVTHGVCFIHCLCCQRILWTWVNQTSERLDDVLLRFVRLRAVLRTLGERRAQGAAFAELADAFAFVTYDRADAFLAYSLRYLPPDLALDFMRVPFVLDNLHAAKGHKSLISQFYNVPYSAAMQSIVADVVPMAGSESINAQWSRFRFRVCCLTDPRFQFSLLTFVFQHNLWVRRHRRDHGPKLERARERAALRHAAVRPVATGSAALRLHAGLGLPACDASAVETPAAAAAASSTALVIASVAPVAAAALEAAADASDELRCSLVCFGNYCAARARLHLRAADRASAPCSCATRVDLAFAVALQRKPLVIDSLCGRIPRIHDVGLNNFHFADGEAHGLVAAIRGHAPEPRPDGSVLEAAAAAAGLPSSASLARSSVTDSAAAAAASSLSLDVGTRNALDASARERELRAQRRSAAKSGGASSVDGGDAGAGADGSAVPAALALARALPMAAPAPPTQLLDGVRLLVSWLPTNGRTWADTWVAGAELARSGAAEDAMEEYLAVLARSQPPGASFPSSWRVGQPCAARGAARGASTAQQPIVSFGAPDAIAAIAALRAATQGVAAGKRARTADQPEREPRVDDIPDAAP